MKQLRTSGNRSMYSLGSEDGKGKSRKFRQSPNISWRSYVLRAYIRDICNPGFGIGICIKLLCKRVTNTPFFATLFMKQPECSSVRSCHGSSCFCYGEMYVWGWCLQYIREYPVTTANIIHTAHESAVDQSSKPKGNTYHMMIIPKVTLLDRLLLLLLLRI